MTYDFDRRMWRFELTPYHRNQNQAISCQTSLAVSPYTGSAVEFFAMMFDSLLWFNTFSDYLFAEVVTKCFISAYMQLLGESNTHIYKPTNLSCHSADSLLAVES